MRIKVSPHVESICQEIPYSCSMEPAVIAIMERFLNAGGSAYHIVMTEEDLSSSYPGMKRYTVRISSEGRTLGLVRTNSYEYPPSTSLRARDVAAETTTRWEEQLLRDPDTFLSSLPPIPATGRRILPKRGVVIIQGSPRPGGNCALLASWAADAARQRGEEATVHFPHDLDIHPCIGCYQCYNTGTCIFDDDMAAIIEDVSRSRLVVVCSPVYTNSVPAGLKALIDRFQALHAERTFSAETGTGKGLLLAVAGRQGSQNFRCVKAVAGAFFSLLGITPANPILIDGMDQKGDLNSFPDVREQVRTSVNECLIKG